MINNRVEDLINLHNSSNNNSNLQDNNIMVFLIKAEVVCNNNNNSNNNKINKMLNNKVVKNLPVKKDNKHIIFLEVEKIISINLRDQLNKHQVINKLIMFLTNRHNLSHREMQIDKDKWLVIVFLEVMIIISHLKIIVFFYNFIILLKFNFLKLLCNNHLSR